MVLDGLRSCALVLLVAATLTCRAPQAFAIADGDEVVLRTGTVTVRPVAADETPATKVAAMGTQQASMYLVKYLSLDSALQFRSVLLERGGGIVSHMPAEQAVIVSGKPSAVLAAAGQTRSLIAEYEPKLKVSPEMATVVSHVQASLTTRRRLSEQDGLAVADDTAQSTRHGSILDTLQTWDDVQHYAISAASKDGTARRLLAGIPSGPGNPRFGVTVQFFSDSDSGESGASSQDIQASLASWLGVDSPEHPCHPPVITTPDPARPQHTLVTVYLCEEHMKEGVTFLSELPDAVWIAPPLRTTKSNAHAAWIVQTGDIDVARYKDPTAELRPYWKAGLLGEGQIVGVSDSGIDMRHCFFIDDRYDPENMTSQFKVVPMPYLFSPVLKLSMPDHRKVVQYVITPFGNMSFFGDHPSDGHGTHACGTVAGSRLSASGELINENATGAAPMARISLVDLAYTSSMWRVPWLLHITTLMYHADAGARISSDSWNYNGVLGVAYNVLAQSFDIHAWTTPEHLSIVSAGNQGAYGVSPSVTAPATAKNVIAVGATTNHPPGNISAYNDLFSYRFYYTDVDVGVQFRNIFPSLSSPKWRGILDNKTVPVVLANPSGACSPIQDLSGSPYVVLVDLQAAAKCNYSDVAKNVNSSGAAGVFYIRPDDGFYYEGLSGQTPDWSSQTIAYAIIPKEFGQWMWSTMVNSSSGSFFVTLLRYPLVDFGTESIASFSAIGPWPEGRIKPDVVAPGARVLSALAGNEAGSTNSATCSSETVYQQGTSVATPVVSGHAALMRQYFMEGYYPGGSPSLYESTAFTPSGMALKAAIVGGARSMKGGSALATGAPLGDSPDGFQGWGRMDLSGSLPVPGITHPNMRIQVADWGTIKQGDIIRLEGLRATGTGSIIATLVWNDYPAAPMSDNLLYNDLDFKYILNEQDARAFREDHKNNVERIELSGLKAGDNVTFLVQGTRVVHELEIGSLSQLPQRWSVVVVGHFTGSLKSNLNPSYAVPQKIKPASSKATYWSLNSYRVQIALAGGACLRVQGSTLSSAASCSPSDRNTFFKFSEKKDPGTNGTVYMIQDFTGRCMTISKSVQAPKVCMQSCNNGLPQLFATFKDPYNTGPVFNLVPRALLGGTATKPRMCLSSTGAAGSNPISVVACNEGIAAQGFALIVHNITNMPPTPPAPSPPPPSPSPSPLTAPWLSIVMTWTPADNNSAPIADLDPFVEWTPDFLAWTVTVTRHDTQSPVLGGLFVSGGNGSNHDLVLFNDSSTPPMEAEYHVCASWYEDKSINGTYDITAYVYFNGEIEAIYSKVWNTTLFQDLDQQHCAEANGFMGSFVYPQRSPPPSPPRPPRPPPRPRGSPRASPIPRPAAN